MASGTLTGGWRIIHTLGARVIKLDPIHGFAAETSAATVIQVATHFGLPSLHHARDHRRDHGHRRHAAPVGGALGRGRQHRHRLVLTLPAAAVVAGIVYTIMHVVS